MQNCPKPLEKGSVIRIVAPAKAIDSDKIDYAKTLLENKGFGVQVSTHCNGKYNYFSGTISERLHDLQEALVDPEVDAILCARGGYGCIQLVDKLDWRPFLSHPKWLIGFSDITVLHQKLATLGACSIHGTMPLNFEENSPEAINTLIENLTGEEQSIYFKSTNYDHQGTSTGILLGGNLSILYSLLGTDDQPDYTNSVLFVEDLAEHLYHLDRIFHALRKAGVLEKISGLIVGGMTDMKDTVEPFGESCESIIKGHVLSLGIPLAFGFPAGHQDDNRSLILGRKVELSVSSDGNSLSYL